MVSRMAPLLGAVLWEGVLQDGERVKRGPLAGVDLRCRAVDVRRTTGPAPVGVLARQEPRDRDLRARIVDRAGSVDRAQHEQDVRLVEEWERDLAPQIARLGPGGVGTARHAVREEELDTAAQRSLDLAGPRVLGERRETPDEARVTPGAGLVGIDPA